jgi:hypothetical protein
MKNWRIRTTRIARSKLTDPAWERPKTRPCRSRRLQAALHEFWLHHQASQELPPGFDTPRQGSQVDAQPTEWNGASLLTQGRHRLGKAEK